MRRLLVVAGLALGCGGRSTDEAAGDAAPESPADLGMPTIDTGVPDVPSPVPTSLEVVPTYEVLFVDPNVVPPLPASLVYKILEQQPGGSRRDVSSTTKLWLDDPELGTFAASTFSTATPLPIRWGRRTVVRAEHEGKLGRADLMVLQFRKTGVRHDLFFVAPYLGLPSPPSDILHYRTDPKDAPSDVTARLKNDPENPDGVDGTWFVERVRAMGEGSVVDGCPPHPTADTDGDGVAETFVSVAADTRLCFEIKPRKNGKVKPSAEARYYAADVELLRLAAPSTIDLRYVLLIVPPPGPTP